MPPAAAAGGSAAPLPVLTIEPPTPGDSGLQEGHKRPAPCPHHLREDSWLVYCGRPPQPAAAPRRPRTEFPAYREVAGSHPAAFTANVLQQQRQPPLSDNPPRPTWSQDALAGTPGAEARTGAFPDGCRAAHSQQRGFPLPNEAPPVPYVSKAYPPCPSEAAGETRSEENPVTCATDPLQQHLHHPNDAPPLPYVSKAYPPCPSADFSDSRAAGETRSEEDPVTCATDPLQQHLHHLPNDAPPMTYVSKAYPSCPSADFSDARATGETYPATCATATLQPNDAPMRYVSKAYPPCSDPRATVETRSCEIPSQPRVHHLHDAPPMPYVSKARPPCSSTGTSDFRTTNETRNEANPATCSAAPLQHRAHHLPNDAPPLPYVSKAYPPCRQAGFSDVQSRATGETRSQDNPATFAAAPLQQRLHHLSNDEPSLPCVSTGFSEVRAMAETCSDKNPATCAAAGLHLSNDAPPLPYPSQTHPPCPKGSPPAANGEDRGGRLPAEARSEGSPLQPAAAAGAGGPPGGRGGTAPCPDSAALAGRRKAGAKFSGQEFGSENSVENFEFGAERRLRSPGAGPASAVEEQDSDLISLQEVCVVGAGAGAPEIPQGSLDDSGGAGCAGPRAEDEAGALGRRVSDDCSDHSSFSTAPSATARQGATAPTRSSLHTPARTQQHSSPDLVNTPSISASSEPRTHPAVDAASSLSCSAGTPESKPVQEEPSARENRASCSLATSEPRTGPPVDAASSLSCSAGTPESKPVQEEPSARKHPVSCSLASFDPRTRFAVDTVFSLSCSAGTPESKPVEEEPPARKTPVSRSLAASAPVADAQGPPREASPSRPSEPHAHQAPATSAEQTPAATTAPRSSERAPAGTTAASGSGGVWRPFGSEAKPVAGGGGAAACAASAARVEAEARPQRPPSGEAGALADKAAGHRFVMSPLPPSPPRLAACLAAATPAFSQSALDDVSERPHLPNSAGASSQLVSDDLTEQLSAEHGTVSSMTQRSISIRKLDKSVGEACVRAVCVAPDRGQNAGVVRERAPTIEQVEVGCTVGIPAFLDAGSCEETRSCRVATAEAPQPILIRPVGPGQGTSSIPWPAARETGSTDAPIACTLTVPSLAPQATIHPTDLLDLPVSRPAVLDSDSAVSKSFARNGPQTGADEEARLLRSPRQAPVCKSLPQPPVSDSALADAPVTLHGLKTAAGEVHLLGAMPDATTSQLDAPPAGSSCKGALAAGGLLFPNPPKASAGQAQSTERQQSPIGVGAVVSRAGVASLVRNAPPMEMPSPPYSAHERVHSVEADSSSPPRSPSTRVHPPNPELVVPLSPLRCSIKRLPTPRTVPLGAEITVPSSYFHAVETSSAASSPTLQPLPDGPLTYAPAALPACFPPEILHLTMSIDKPSLEADMSSQERTETLSPPRGVESPNEEKNAHTLSRERAGTLSPLSRQAGADDIRESLKVAPNVEVCAAPKETCSSARESEDHTQGLPAKRSQREATRAAESMHSPDRSGKLVPTACVSETMAVMKGLLAGGSCLPDAALQWMLKETKAWRPVEKKECAVQTEDALGTDYRSMYVNMNPAPTAASPAIDVVKFKSDDRSAQLSTQQPPADGLEPTIATLWVDRSANATKPASNERSAQLNTHKTPPKEHQRQVPTTALLRAERPAITINLKSEQLDVNHSAQPKPAPSTLAAESLAAMKPKSDDRSMQPNSHQGPPESLASPDALPAVPLTATAGPARNPRGGPSSSSVMYINTTVGRINVKLMVTSGSTPQSLLETFCRQHPMKDRTKKKLEAKLTVALQQGRFEQQRAPVPCP
ncbi:hypothetical protein DIPPA_09737 [Diplonema papillatum]|nr:hypothetical protein DIPPA_09737 [Diplonema papillatum]